VTLKNLDADVTRAAGAMRKFLASSGFKPNKVQVVWRDHLLNRAYADLWSRNLAPGKKMKLPGQTLDYAVLLRETGATSVRHSQH